jgi:flagellar hook-associated protein 3 FlgL
MVKPVPSFLVAMLARTDLARINQSLYDLQRQTASGNVAADLKGYGAESGRIVSARAAIAQAEARVAAANRLSARLDIQDAALGRVAQSAATLKQGLMDALASDNGTYLAEQVNLAFRTATDALNTTYEGVPLFTGDRRGAAAVQISAIGDLAGALTQSTLFAESDRVSSADFGLGQDILIADKASTIARPLYGVLRDLHAFATASGVGAPMTADQRATLVGLVANLDGAHQTVLNAQGRNGERQAQLERVVTRLTNHADLLTKHLGQVAEADLAEVAMRLSAAQTQYQAAASVFAQIRDLSLVNFLD